MARWFQYQAKTEPLPVPVVVVASFLSIVQFTGLFQYQVKAEPVLVPPPPVADVISPTVITSEVTFPRSIIYQHKTEPVLVSVAAVEGRIATTETSQVIFSKSIVYQQKVEPVVAAAPAATTINWFSPLAEPTKRKSFINQQDNNPQLFSSTDITDTVFVPFSGNVRVQFTRQWQYQVKSDPIAVPAAPIDPGNTPWYSPWSTPRFTKNKIYDQGAISTLFVAAPEVITEDKWHQAWSQPVRVKPKVVFQRDLAWSGYTPAVAVVTAVEPTTITSQVVFPRSVIYQSLAWTPQTITPLTFRYFNLVEGDTGLTYQKTIIYQQIAQVESPETHVFWYRPLSEPVRQKRGLSANQQQFLAWSGHTPAATPQVTAVITATATSQVTFKRSIIYQSLAWCPQTIAPPPAVAYFSYIEGDTGLIFRKKVIYQSIAQAESPETHTFWHQPWSEPVRQKSGLRAYLQQEPAWSTHTPAATPQVTAVVNTTATSQVVFPRSIIYQGLAWVPRTITPEVITEDKWHQAWSQPVRTRKLTTAQRQAHFGPEATIPTPAAVTAVEPTTTTSQVTFPRSIIYQSLAWPPQTIAPEVITEDKWHQAWSQPVRVKRLATAQQRSFFGPEAVIPQPAVVYFPYAEGDTGLIFRKKFIYQSLAQAESAETHIFWHQWWSEPVRQKPGLKTHLQQEPAWNPDTPAFVPPVVTAVTPTTVTSQVTFPRSIIYQSVAWASYRITPEVITEDKWHQAWSVPVRTKPGLGIWQQRDLFWSGHTPAPEVITEDKWHQTWSQPVRTRRFGTAQQQALVWSSHTPAPEVITEDKWHQPWSIPVKLKKTFLTDLQQAVAAPPTYPIFFRIMPWYEPLSEPVRLKKGIGARFQQFFNISTDPIVSPVFVILDATETNNDVASIFAVVYNPPVRVYVSIKEVPGSDPTYASIEETD